METFPLEQYIELENNPYLLGRIIVHKIQDRFNAEIDIIHKESHKIFKHVAILYQHHSGNEALLSGVQRLRLFLSQVEEEKEQIQDKSRNFH